MRKARRILRLFNWPCNVVDGVVEGLRMLRQPLEDADEVAVAHPLLESLLPGDHTEPSVRRYPLTSEDLHPLSVAGNQMATRPRRVLEDDVVRSFFFGKGVHRPHDIPAALSQALDQRATDIGIREERKTGH